MVVHKPFLNNIDKADRRSGWDNKNAGQSIWQSRIRGRPPPKRFDLLEQYNLFRQHRWQWHEQPQYPRLRQNNRGQYGNLRHHLLDKNNKEKRLKAGQK